MKNVWLFSGKQLISSSIGSANGSTEITKLFYNKYRSLYNSVPTDDNELHEIHDVINSNNNNNNNICLKSYLHSHNCNTRHY